MNAIFLSAFLLVSQVVSQAFEIVPIAGSFTVTNDGIGDAARFGSISSIWGQGSDLYIADGPKIRKLNLVTREVSTLTVRAGTNRISGSMTPSQYSGLKGLWGDGTYLFATDSGAETIQRINLSTAAVDSIPSGASVPWGLTGTASHLIVGSARTREIIRVNRATNSTDRLGELAPPTDPAMCGGSGCVNYFVPAPKALWSNGQYVYATGFNTSIRRVDLATGETISLPELPFMPGTLWGDASHVYVTSGLEIGRQDLQTGEYQTIVRLPTPAPFSSIDEGFGSIWGQAGALYVSRGGTEIVRIDIATGQVNSVAGVRRGAGELSRLEQVWGEGGNLYVVDSGNRLIRKIDAVTGAMTTFAGRTDRQGFIDGVGTEASFAEPRGIWGNGSQLFVGDARGVRRIELATAQVTTLTGSDVGLGPAANNPQNGPASTARLGSATALWAVGDYLYAGDCLMGVIAKIHLQTGEVSTLAGGAPTGYVDGPGVDARFRKTCALWSDGSILYVLDGYFIRTVSVATAEVRTLTTIPDAGLQAIWGDGDYLYVAGAGSGLRMWRVSRSTGAFETVLDGGSGPTGGLNLQTGAYGLWGDGQNLFAVTPQAVLRLEPRPMPTAVSYRLNPAEGTAWNIGRETAPTISLGYASIDAGAQMPSGMLIYAYRQNGTIISETSVPASPPVREGRIHAAVQGPTNTGLAIANPGDAPADISFHFTDSAGLNFGAGTVTIPPHQQIARFLNEAPFSGGSSIQGTFTFRSSVPVGAVALRGLTNERSEFLMTTLPISPLAAGGSTTTILPHYAAGGGWTTEIALVNPTDVAITGTLEFQGTVPYNIPPRSSRVFTSADSPSATTGAVWITPMAGGAPSTVGIFSFRKDGITVTSAGVPEVRASKAFEVFSEGAGNFRQAAQATMGAGIAIANPGTSDVSVHVDQFTLDGSPTARSGLITVPAHGHVSLFTHEVPHASPDPSTWLGDWPGPSSLRIWTESEAGISVIGLRARYNERADFLVTTTPVLADDAPHVAGPALFPHFAQGGGYTTEFVLLNQPSGAIAQGKVNYFSQSGQPVANPPQ